MMRSIRPRLRKPAWIFRAIAMYRWAGKDSDEGALAGSRADERQKLLSLRSRALAGNSAMLMPV
jgi:hypothetical protein